MNGEEGGGVVLNTFGILEKGYLHPSRTFITFDMIARVVFVA